VILYPGSTTPIDRRFPDSENAVTVVAKAFNGLTIPTTPAENQGEGIWRTVLSIPATAPVMTSDSGYYKLIWTHSGGTVEQEFQVVGYDEGAQTPAPAGFGVERITLSDEVLLPYGATAITCEIINLGGDPVLPLQEVTGENDSSGSVRATAEFAIPLLGVGEYIAHWRYMIGSTPYHDYRQAFVVSAKTTSILSSMRMYLDQAGITRFLGHQQYHDVELIDCLYRGCDRINGHAPQATSFVPDNMPFGLAHAMRFATLHEMLNRLYLAEGLASFNFQGGSITVDVEQRLSAIQTKMDEINSWLESNLTNTKMATMSGRSLGVLHVTVSQGGYNNNFRARGRVLSPQAFNLNRAYGYI